MKVTPICSRLDRRTATGSSNLVISHFTEKDIPLGYEPFFVAGSSVPPFDERLIGYGMTRSAQVKAFYGQSETSIS